MTHHQNASQWTQNEDQTLYDLVTRNSQKNWKDIFREFSQFGFQKTLKQCKSRFRQKFINTQWNQTELILFQKYFDEYGPEWRLIQQFLPGKSQIALKNKFNGTVKHFLRMLWKAMGFKTSQVLNKMIPKELLQIYNGKGRIQRIIQIFSKTRPLVKNALRQLNFNLQKNEVEKIIKEQKQDFIELFQLINENMTKDKKNSQIKINTNNQTQVVPQISRQNQDILNYNTLYNNFYMMNGFQYPFQYYSMIPPIIHQNLPYNPINQ